MQTVLPGIWTRVAESTYYANNRFAMCSFSDIRHSNKHSNDEFFPLRYAWGLQREDGVPTNLLAIDFHFDLVSCWDFTQLVINQSFTFVDPSYTHAHTEKIFIRLIKKKVKTILLNFFNEGKFSGFNFQTMLEMRLKRLHDLMNWFKIVCNISWAIIFAKWKRSNLCYEMFFVCLILF